MLPTYHLVDTENMPVDWINLINLTTDDHVLLFRLKDSNKNYVTLDDLVKIAQERIFIKIIECEHGKPKMNALDFQLATWVGYLIGSNHAGAIKVYTNDTGFEPAVDFWKNKHVNVEIIKSEN